jgi:hypothetical protein
MLTADDFTWDETWTSRTTLQCWAGFQSRLGPYGSRDSTDPSTGLVTIVFAPDGRDASRLRAEELALVNWTIAQQTTMRDAALSGLLSRYPAMRADYLQWIERPQDMPPIENVDDFKQLIGLHAVHVHPFCRDGVPYVGLEFGCTWDPEHGLGVMLHGARVVDIGGADTAIYEWIARRDAERPP